MGMGTHVNFGLLLRQVVEAGVVFLLVAILFALLLSLFRLGPKGIASCRGSKADSGVQLEEDGHQRLNLRLPNSCAVT